MVLLLIDHEGPPKPHATPAPHNPWIKLLLTVPPTLQYSTPKARAARLPYLSTPLGVFSMSKLPITFCVLLLEIEEFPFWGSSSPNVRRQTRSHRE